MFYFETNITTTNNSPSMYPNDNTSMNNKQENHGINGIPQQQVYTHGGDYQYQQGPQMQQQPIGIPNHVGQASMIPGGQAAKGPYQSGRFTSQDIQLLKQLMVTGEKYKWKEITKEINKRAYERKNDDPTTQSSIKNVSPTFVIKQYQSLLGLPNNSLHFGSVGSSLPYIVAANGWDDINESQCILGNDID